MKTLLAVLLWLPNVQEPTKGGQEKTSFEKHSFPFEGEVTGTSLYVRLVPKADPTNQPVTVLKQGAHVTVVGEKDDFYQILPPTGCFVWIFAKSVKKEGDEGIVTVNETPLRTDSRIGADKLATLTEGTKVKILAEHIGWYKIQAPDAVKYFVGKKYVKFVGESTRTEIKKETPKLDEDALATAKIREAETLIAEMNRHIEAGELELIDFDRIVALFDEAMSLAKSESVKKEAESGAKSYRSLQTIWNTYKAQRKSIEEKIQMLKEEQLKAKKTVEKTYAFSGYVDCTSWSMADRPGTHKLILGDKTICFVKIKEGDAEMLKKLNNCYKRYVGINGTVVKDPKGWEGYNVVVVEEITVLTK